MWKMQIDVKRQSTLFYLHFGFFSNILFNFMFFFFSLDPLLILATYKFVGAHSIKGQSDKEGTCILYKNISMSFVVLKYISWCMNLSQILTFPNTYS